MTGEPQWALASRVVFPVDHDEDLLPLYVEFGRRYPGVDDTHDEKVRTWGEAKASGTPASAGIEGRSDDVLSRTSFAIRPGQRVSFATYFNAFPASYWRRWTTAERVRLRVAVEGEATVLVYRSNARGSSIRLHRFTTGAPSANHPSERTEPTVVEVDLDLVPLVDGGWYWFDIVAGGQPAVLASAEWLIFGEPQREARLSIGVTTVNKPEYVRKIVAAIAGAHEVRQHLDKLYIVDQGTQAVQEQPGWDAAAEPLGTQLRVITQANLGGSGGFSRGMYETLTAGSSTFHMVLDDDVSIEPESIVRAVRFASFARRPTIVGAHMFDIHNPTALHSFGEEVDPVKWTFGAVRGVHEEHNLAFAGLRETPWLHRRVDVGYTGWWMCLIPVEVLREVGLSLPVFIKWDDAEHCMRARAAGFPTVSLPGSAVWHVSWNDKDDLIDWQAYYHQRNLLISCLLHTTAPQGGQAIRQSIQALIKNAYSMRYYANAVRLQGLRDLFRGPEHLHATIGETLPQLRALAADYADVRFKADPDAFPKPIGQHLRPPPRLPKRSMLAPWVAKTAIRHLRPTALGAQAAPQALVPQRYAVWWYLSQYDSAVVSKSDGTGAALYARQPETFRAQMAEGVRLHVQLYRQWDALAKAYQDAVAEITSPAAWARTFGLDDPA